MSLSSELLASIVLEPEVDPPTESMGECIWGILHNVKQGGNLLQAAKQPAEVARERKCQRVLVMCTEGSIIPWEKAGLESIDPTRWWLSNWGMQWGRHDAIPESHS